MATSHKQAGAMIAIMAAIFTVVGMTIFRISIPIACGIAVIGILIGTGVARGKFSRPRRKQERIEPGSVRSHGFKAES